MAYRGFCAARTAVGKPISISQPFNRLVRYEAQSEEGL
jgi:hypothetical protein